MAKASFRDLLNFEPIAPYVDDPPTVDSRKYGDAVSAVPGDSPSEAHRRTAVYGGEYERGADKFAYHFGNVVTGAQAFVNALPNENDFDSTAIANVLGDVGRSFSFMNYIRRQYSHPGRTQPTVSEMVKDARTMRSLMEETISDINDPMNKYRAAEGLGSYTNRNYTSREYNGTANFGVITETHSGLSLQETYRAALAERQKSYRNGTLIHQFANSKHPILDLDPYELSALFRQFTNKWEKYVKYRDSDSYPVVDYYKYISTPAFGRSENASPQEALKFAVENLGFSSGYKDWEGFSLGSSHMWGVTIKPYVSPNGIGVSLAPNLPVVEVPVWDVVDGELKCTFKQFDYGKMPPVTQYSFEVGSLRGSHIPLFDGNFNMPLGFDFENKLTLTFLEDEYHSMQKYMSMFINNIYRPTVGLMAPYDLCTWLVTLTAFRPGMNVNYSFNLICVPEAYTMSYQGTEGPGMETMNIALSIIGIKSPDNSGAEVAPSGRADARDTWSKVNWNDVTVKPVDKFQFTDYDAPEHRWGEPKDFSRIKAMESAAEVAAKAQANKSTPSGTGKGGNGTASGSGKGGNGTAVSTSSQSASSRVEENLIAQAQRKHQEHIDELFRGNGARDPAADYKNSHGKGFFTKAQEYASGILSDIVNRDASSGKESSGVGGGW